MKIIKIGENFYCIAPNNINFNTYLEKFLELSKVKKNSFAENYLKKIYNCVFTGSIREHCIYEKKLKFALRSYIRSGEINVNSTVVRRFTTPQQLCDYVIQIHQQYLKCNKTVESDCRYIVALCHVAVAGILNLLEHYRNSNPVSAAAAA